MMDATTRNIKKQTTTQNQQQQTLMKMATMSQLMEPHTIFISREWHEVDDDSSKCNGMKTLMPLPKRRTGGPSKKKYVKRADSQKNNNSSNDNSSNSSSNSSEDMKERINKKRFFSDALDTKGGAFTSRGNFDRLKKKSLKTNKKSNGKNTTVEKVFNTLTEKLIHCLSNQTHKCDVCSDIVKRHVATWSCSNCFNVFHLGCIRKLATDSIKEKKEWKCPTCVQSSTTIPNTYYCFCHKHVDPHHDMFLTPHGCGEECGKKRADPKCPHACSISCHPGPCPECVGTRDEQCYCGKETLQVYCAEVGTKGVSCKQVCGKLLGCGRHTCQDICHSGDCSPCIQVYEQSCFCGKVHKTKLCEPCNEEGKDVETGMIKTFACEHSCPLVLPCGHKCDRMCHSGKCIDKKLAWGSVLDISDDVDEYVKMHGCFQQCRNKLSCGHYCKKKCHPQQSCSEVQSECTEKLKVTCPCGRLNGKMACSQLHQILNERFPDGSVDARSNPAVLDCDKKCLVLKRIQEFEATEVDFEKQKLPYYSQFIQDFAKKDPDLIKTVEEGLDYLLYNDSEEEKSHEFPAMGKLKRRVVYELAEKYGFSARAVNAEPHRSVTVTRTKTASRPLLLLSNILNSTDRAKELLSKVQAIEEAQQLELEKEALEIQKRREAKAQEKLQQKSRDWGADDETIVVAKVDTEFNISDFRHAQKTKSAPSSGLSQQKKDDNIWSALNEADQ
jgi:hypothetical protein